MKKNIYLFIILLMVCSVSYAIDFNNVSHINRIPIENISDINNISLSWQQLDPDPDPDPDYTETFYVTEDNDGSGSGTLSDPWSREEFNELTFSTMDAADGIVGPGDCVFLAGRLTGQLNIPDGGVDGVGVITIDGYEDSDSVNPNEGDDTSGFAYFDGVHEPILLSGKSHIVIQDIRIDDWTSSRSGAVEISGNWTDISIYRLHIENGANGSARAFYVTSSSSGKDLLIQKCYIDGVVDPESIGDGIAIESVSTSDVTIRYNRFSGCIDSINLTGNTGYILIENNWFEDKYDTAEEDHIDLKFNVNHVVIRYNRFEDIAWAKGYSAIQCQLASHDNFIYGNSMYNALNAVYIYGGAKKYEVDDVGPYFVWSNVMVDCYGGLYSKHGDNSKVGTYYFYGNTIVGSTGKAKTANPPNDYAGWAPIAGTAIGQNNLFLNNYFFKDPSNPRAIHVPNGNRSNVTSSYNLGYHDSYTAQVYWGSSGTLSFEDHGSNNTQVNPSLNENYEPTLSSTAVIDQGTTISDALLPGAGSYFEIDGIKFCSDEATCPDGHLSFTKKINPATTDFTTNPPTVGMSSVVGAAPDIGAYEYQN